MKYLKLLLIIFSVPTLVGYVAIWQNPYSICSLAYWLLIISNWVVCGIWGYSVGMRYGRI